MDLRFAICDLRCARTRAALFSLVVGLGLLSVGTAFGVDAATAFDQANKLFEQGKYPEAIAAYQALIEQGAVSPALYFNLGNACFKNGQVGRAIANYQLAQRLAPRDPDIRANLRFARESVAGPALRSRFWQRSLYLLTVNELAVLVAIVVWLWFLVLIAGQFRREWGRELRPYKIVLGLVTLLAVLWLAVVVRERFGTDSAVVVIKEAAVRYGPFEEAQRFYMVKDGAELTVLDRKDNWLQVSDGSKRAGWLQGKDVRVLPRG